jgi:hypothetical protein
MKEGDAMKHALLIAPLLLAGATMPLTAAWADTVKLGATMNGASETPPGDADGAGAFAAEVDTEKGDFCYTITSTKIAAPTMAHVHTGAAGVAGPPVITIDPKGSDECVAVEPDVLKAIVANPAGYYVNVHNAEFPGGAIRGQLMKK